MNDSSRRRMRGAVLGCWLLLGPVSTALASQQTEERRGTAAAGPELPTGIEIDFVGQLRQTEEGHLLFTGPVTVTWKGSRIQADRISLLEERYIEAEGNVLVAWEGNRISGSRMTYDLELERGVIEDAVGQVQNDYLFWARRAEKIGEDRVRVESATFTTCTQPTPYWSFSVSSATIRVNKYARMWNVRLRASRLPVIYLPYLVWPVKKDRAAGLLMPEFHSTLERGDAVSQQLFIPLGRSADLTLEGRYYTEAGFGGGGELRLVPNRRGTAMLEGFYIDDKVAGTGRYAAAYRQTQKFRNGFRMLADINLVSDFDYFSDFERELSLVSSPTILARLEFSRNGPWTSMNVRELRREQLFSDDSELVQQTLPEIEWRGRSRRLGKTPLYLSYESSLASIQQQEDPAPCPPSCGLDPPLDADYFRADVFPTVSLPLSPRPWLEITPLVRYRFTYYTQRLEEVDLGGGATARVASNRSLSRGLWGGGLEIAGPKLFRIFEQSEGSAFPRYKHSIEPRIVYGYQEAFDRTDEIVLYDEVDRFTGAGEQVSYAIVQRLFTQRPRAEPAAAEGPVEPVVLADGTVSEEPSATGSDGPPPADAPREPLEIATLELRQTRSLDRSLSFADLDRDGTNEAESRSSPIQLIGRYNPSPKTSFDVRGNYNILYNTFSDVTLSGSVRRTLARMRFSLVYRNGLGVRNVGTSTSPVLEPIADDTQLRLTTGFNLLSGKLRLDVDGSFDADPAMGQKHVPDKRWRLQYSTQCCTFLIERLARNFSADTDRRDFYFRIDLKGVGKLLDFKY